jgi:hypothetical protein
LSLDLGNTRVQNATSGSYRKSWSDAPDHALKQKMRQQHETLGISAPVVRRAGKHGEPTEDRIESLLSRIA